MLTDLHTTLQRLLYERGQISPDEVDIRFEMPNREWVESLLQPTLNLYLFAVEENIELRQTNVQSMQSNGRGVFRMPPRRFDLRFMVSVLTTNIVDEHQLLWRTLATLLKYADFPKDVLAEPLIGLQPPLSAQISKTDEDTKLLDIWSALDQPPRPSLLYVVTAPLDLEIEFTAPLVLTRTTRYTRTTAGDEARGQGIDQTRITSRNPGGEPQDGVALVMSRIGIGGVVRDTEGKPLEGVVVGIEGSADQGSITTKEGRFVLSGLQVGTIKLHVVGVNGVATIVPIKIPSDSYDITLE